MLSLAYQTALSQLSESSLSESSLSCQQVKSLYKDSECCSPDSSGSVALSSCPLVDKSSYDADLKLFQDTLRQHLALRNPRPLEHISHFQDDDVHVMYGYTAKIVNEGNNLIVGGPSSGDDQYSDKTKFDEGKIVIWENLFGSGTWVPQGILKAPATVPDDVWKNGYGRYVTSSDDATVIAQNSWMGGSPNGLGYATVEQRLDTSANQASLPVSAFTYTTTGTPYDLTLSGIDGTYTVEDGLIPGGDYGDISAGAVSVPEIQWVLDFGGSITVQTKDNKVYSVTLSGFDRNYWYQSEVDAMVAAGSPVRIAPPNYKYETVAILPRSYNIAVSRDASTFAHWTRVDSLDSYSFYIHSYNPTTKTNTLLYTFPGDASCAGFRPITMSRNGDTVITACDGSVPYRFDRNGDTYVQSPMHARTKLKWVQGANGWEQQSVPLVPTQASQLEMSYDDTTLILGDRKDQIVEVYVREGSGNFTLDSTIRGKTGNFAGGHSGIAISEDNQLIAVTARRTQVNGVDWKGSAYLYQRNGAEWKRVATIPTDLSGKVDMFGNTIDVKYNKLIVSALNMFDESKGGFVDMYNVLPE